MKERRIRFLAGVITCGFVGVAVELAVVLDGGLLGYLAATIPLAGWHLATREFGFLEDDRDAEDRLAADGGQEYRETSTGGDRNRRSNN